MHQNEQFQSIMGSWLIKYIQSNIRIPTHMNTHMHPGNSMNNDSGTLRFQCQIPMHKPKYGDSCDLEQPKRKATTLVGTEPHPMETKVSILVSGHKSCASLMAKTVGLLATIAPSCQRFMSDEIELGKKEKKETQNKLLEPKRGKAQGIQHKTRKANAK